MTDNKFFPYILTRKTPLGVEGVSCIRIRSILKGELMVPNSGTEDQYKDFNHPLDPKVLQESRETLVHAFTSWDPNLTIELHLTTLPDISRRARGQVNISIFLRTIERSDKKVKASIIQHYLNLMPLLSATIPESEFEPVDNAEEFNMRWQPFKGAYATSIQRKKDIICLAEPLDSLPIGFGKDLKHKEEDDHLVMHTFPWVPSFDSWERLLNLMLGQLDPVRMTVRLGPDNNNRDYMNLLVNTINRCELFLSGANTSRITSQEQARIIRNISLRQISRLKENRIRVGVFLIGAHPIDSSLVSLIARSITGPKNIQDIEYSLQGGYSFCDVEMDDVLDLYYYSEKESFTPHEAACAFRLPSPPTNESIGLPVKRHKTSIACLPEKVTSEKTEIKLFNNIHNHIYQPVFMENEDRFRHFFVIGQTGVGKSSAMENMILQDIKNDKGLAVIDPHGDMVDSIIRNIPDKRIKDVILFDLTDKEYPVGFNIMQWKSIEERDIIIDELYTTIDSIYDLKTTGGPIFEKYFRGALKAVLGDRPRTDYIPTIQNIITFFINPEFRVRLKKQSEDKDILDFIREIELAGSDASLANVTPYITSKLSRFMNDTALLRIVGQKKTNFDFDEIINGGKIFLVKLGKGRFGSVVSSLLANHIVSRFKLAAMKRGDMRIEDRRDFFLYCDECHTLPSENFMELLSEARKYRMGLILSTQYAAQLSSSSNGGNDLLMAILGNVGSIMTFRLGQEDARRLCRVFSPYFSHADITGLPNFEGYMKMHSIHGVIPPFSFRTEKVENEGNEKTAKKVREWSRLKYGKDVKIVDAEIKKNREAWKE